MYLNYELADPSKLGQLPYYQPSVFNFFQTDFVPNGVLGNAGQMSGEAQLITTPSSIAFMNGMNSLFKFGLVDCFGGFGQRRTSTSQSCDGANRGDHQASAIFSGELTFWSNKTTPLTDNLLDVADLLLTGGRLDESTKRLIKEAYEQVQQEKSPEAARLAALQLLTFSAEFHTSNSIHRGLSEPRASDTVTDTENDSLENEPTDYKVCIYYDI